MAAITLVLNEQEQQAFCQLLDTALRQAGLNALDLVSHFMGRVTAAQSAATQTQAAASQRPTQSQPVSTPAQASAQVPPGSAQATQQHTAQAQPQTAQSPVTQHPANAAPAHTGILGQVMEAITGHPMPNVPTAVAAQPAASVAPTPAPSTSAPAVAVPAAQAPAATAQTSVGQPVTTHPGAASVAGGTRTAAPASQNASSAVQHQSVLSHLIGEITGAGHPQSSTHPAAASTPLSATVPQPQGGAAEVASPPAAVATAPVPAAPATGTPAAAS